MSQPVRVVFRSARRAAPAEGEGLRVALYQGQGPVGSREAVEQNLERLAEVAALAADYDCQTVVFPEKYTTGYAIGPEQCRELAEHREGPSIERARLVAKEHGLAVVLPYPERDGDAFYDSISVIASDGLVAANYRKTHLYGAAERRNYSFGQELPPVVTINGVGVGVLNCYECEFPPLYQYLADQGAKIVLGPTAADGHFRLADGTMSQVPYQDATRHIIPAMASIWRLFIAYANRRGWEQVPMRRLAVPGQLRCLGARRRTPHRRHRRRPPPRQPAHRRLPPRRGGSLQPRRPPPHRQPPHPQPRPTPHPLRTASCRHRRTRWCADIGPIPHTAGRRPEGRSGPGCGRPRPGGRRRPRTAGTRRCTRPEHPAGVATTVPAVRTP